MQVYVLDGAPGVLSARYAGDQKSSADNIRLLLENMAGPKDRKGQFRTVITLILGGKTTQFEGVIKGKITERESGNDGFGYDPVFIPEGSTKTFAEMSLSEKNRISHRAIATRKLVDYLKGHTTAKQP